MTSRWWWCAAFLALLSTCFRPASETCSGGVVCSPGFTCSRDGQSCVPASDQCGNGVKDPTEACDDGNTQDNDGCSTDCKSNETCGNRVVDTTEGEVCDDGNRVSGDGCSMDCLSTEVCGNRYVDTARGEVCDDGNRDGGDGCSADCLSTEVCGN